MSITATVDQPVDFVLNGEQTSALSGTLSSALKADGIVYLPVDTTETFQDHFTTRTWNTPDDQVTAGYPVYIQPTPSPGYYEEVFDFGSVIQSSKVNITYTGDVLAGSPTFSTILSTSLDGITWAPYINTLVVFGSNFQYVKFRLTVSGTGGLSLYGLNSLYIRLESKLKTEGGTLACVSTDADGTILNFSEVFLDVQEVQLTPISSTPAIPYYAFKDTVITGTYSVTSNVATINATAHEQVMGQNVRLSFQSGTAPAGVYAVTNVVNANTYEVSITTPNTSGNVSTYSESVRVYLVNLAGTRVNGNVSYSIKGTA